MSPSVFYKQTTGTRVAKTFRDQIRSKIDRGSFVHLDAWAEANQMCLFFFFFLFLFCSFSCWRPFAPQLGRQASALALPSTRSSRSPVGHPVRPSDNPMRHWKALWAVWVDLWPGTDEGTEY